MRDDMIGEHRGIIADAGEKRGIHLRQPRQAEKIQPGYAGDAVVMEGIAVRILHRYVDPAEIDAVTGGPDHRADTGAVEIEALQGFGNARWIGQPCPYLRLFGQIEAAQFDEAVDDVEEGGEDEVAGHHAFSKAGRDLDHAAART